MKFSIEGRVYDAASIDRLTLGNILKLEKETTELGRPMKWSEIKAMSARVQDLEPEDFDDDDDAPWFLALTIWSSMLNAGENVTFAQAVDFPLGELRAIEEPQDRKKPAGPTSARPGSGRAGSPQRKSGTRAKKGSGKR